MLTIAPPTAAHRPRRLAGDEEGAEDVDLEHAAEEPRSSVASMATSRAMPARVDDAGERCEVAFDGGDLGGDGGLVGDVERRSQRQAVDGVRGARASSAGPGRSRTAARQPSASTASTTARPMPEAPPVTRIVPFTAGPR